MVFTEYIKVGNKWFPTDKRWTFLVILGDQMYEIIPKLVINDLLNKASARDLFIGAADDYCCYSLGRYALLAALKCLSKKTNKREILVPAFMCAETLAPIRHNNYSVTYYSVKRNLSVDQDDLRRKISSDTLAVLVVHYFGFPQEIEALVKICKERGVYLIEDCAHALGGAIGDRLLGTFGDIAIFSLRKTIPVSDGGLLRVNDADLINQMNLEDRPSFVWSWKTIIKMVLSSLFVFIENSTGWPIMEWRRSKKTSFTVESSNGVSYRLGDEDKSASSFTKWMYGRLNKTNIVAKRRRNFLLLKEMLAKYPNIHLIFDEIGGGVSPYAFPVLIENREEVIAKLVSKGLIVQTWPIMPEEIDAQTFPVPMYLASNILLFPLHQNIGVKEIEAMNIICDEVLK